jgi:glycerol uptake facilitator-like aquaporin
MIFAGCGSVVVNLSTNGTVTFPGICAVWGVVVMVLVYSLGHISGAHFNPAVTVAFATCGRFPWKQVPSYAAAQVLGSGLASLTLRLVFGGARAILRCGAGGVGDAGTGARVRHILLPHVRRLRGGHRQQSGRRR